MRILLVGKVFDFAAGADIVVVWCTFVTKGDTIDGVRNASNKITKHAMTQVLDSATCGIVTPRE